MALRIGNGYDVHILCEDRKLILGGVEIEFEKGLLGHSDADVLVHAIMDALLGAASLGDIGKHFPDTDEKYKGISSIILLEYVGNLLKENGYTINNIDSIIVAQRPKLAPYIEKMCQNIADALKISKDAVNVKATTTEKLGFEGEGKGISAYSVCLLE
ncbi:MAG: 2-C-methyl-D-erythritol 2,4-cyclodiphosphate synthase [Ruminococcaceae bacterium]|nr:2-C-methyl-D-erythritol 2,4-cyclodiphosphate synthase [Oscillospiraceae bacterium]